MSRIISLIAAENFGLAYYHNLLMESGFDSSLNMNICVRLAAPSGTTRPARVYIDTIIDIHEEAGFEDSLDLYRNLLNVGDDTSLFAWTVSFGDAMLAFRIISIIANRENILVDNDIGLVLNGAEFVTSVDNMEREGSG